MQEEIKGRWGRRKLTGRWPWCLCQLSLQELQGSQVLGRASSKGLGFSAPHLLFS